MEKKEVEEGTWTNPKRILEATASSSQFTVKGKVTVNAKLKASDTLNTI